MQTLVEGQTLLDDGRYRFLRRIGSGTFAVIMQCVNVHVEHQRHVAIKCVRQQEHNALGEREAAALRRVNAQDPDAVCAGGFSLFTSLHCELTVLLVVRLLETFEEQGHFCLVLELLGSPVVDVGHWGPWRQASGARPNRTLQLYKPKRRCSLPPNGQATEAAVSTPPLSLMDVRQMTVYLCGALAFLHGQGLVHADVKPENVVRSGSRSLSSSSPVKLVDFGNCLDTSEVAAYAQEETCGGFDVQTITYRAPEVAAGLLLCSAMDMWSLGCLLLECVSGKPLFTLQALEMSMRERTDVAQLENGDLLEQIERVVTNGVSLDVACARYRSAARFGEKVVTKSKRTDLIEKQKESLQARLEAAVPGNHQFHDFIYSLLDVNPATRVTAKQALFHPFLQAFFPFGTVFAQPSASQIDKGRDVAEVVPSATIVGTKRKSPRTLKALDHTRRKKKSAEIAATARNKDLRQVLKIIPRDVPDGSSLSPRDI
ncbi:CMGC protein kinase [Phytophthora megakarya]|uniref:CMGC protein kinase n=1 Tax=Phytophthora megakarya TaxID=4795 RepID=A0A225W7L3_9STRA|nr:CMGC protein kinase [Phytophthora megakarya]